MLARENSKESTANLLKGWLDNRVRDLAFGFPGATKTACEAVYRPHIQTATHIHRLIYLQRGTLHPESLPLLLENTPSIPLPMLTQTMIHCQEDCYGSVEYCMYKY